MNIVTKLLAPPRVPLVTERSLSQKLEALSAFGAADVRFVVDDRIGGWVAKIEMNTGIGFARFDIASEYKHATPDAAVDELIARVNEALVKMRTRSDLSV
jgi:hypothetical protein